MITVVVPSPTSSSWVRLNSIMLFAAGCDTSISRRMAWPSLVSTMPPMGSSSILSMALGPRHDLMISATLYCPPQNHTPRRSAGIHSPSLGTRKHGTKGEEGRVGLTYVFAAAMFDN